jgi:hypothetical protein
MENDANDTNDEARMIINYYKIKKRNLVNLSRYYFLLGFTDHEGGLDDTNI